MKPAIHITSGDVAGAGLASSGLPGEVFVWHDILALLSELSQAADAPLPWIPAAVARWLQEQPDTGTGEGRLEGLALAAIRAGCETPGRIFAAVAAADTAPQFWGDTTLWAKINALAERAAARADRRPDRQAAPMGRQVPLEDFRIKALPMSDGITMYELPKQEAIDVTEKPQ